MPQTEAFDLVILGSGSTAFAAAIRAAELGRTAAMTESRTLGGTCVNRGCLPSKNLIEAARLYWEATHPRFPGLRPQGMELDFPALIRQKDEVILDYRGKKYESIFTGEDRIKVYSGRAAFAPDGSARVNGTRLVGAHYLIATGSHPVIPQVPGLANVPFMTSDLLAFQEEGELRELPGSLLILGGGYVALELGQMFHRFGTPVTLLERGPLILPDHEPEVAVELTRFLREEGLQLLTEFEISRVERGKSGVIVTGQHQGRAVTLEAERLLVAAGRAPNTGDLGLRHVGVETDDLGFVRVDEFLQTTAGHIWAAGDVIGRQTGSQLATPVGAHDGVIAATNALGGGRRAVDHRVIPRTIFTDPQVATVGLTDAEANRRGFGCACRTVPVSVVPRAGAVRDTRGLVKMVAEAETGRVLGVSLLARDAGEVIHEAAMALRFGATLHDFIDMIHVYPTMAEALKLAALSFFKDVERLSCCAE